MVRKVLMVEKLKPGRETLPCRRPGCDISTNKRYKGPDGKTYVACMFSHAEAAYLLDLARS